MIDPVGTGLSHAVCDHKDDEFWGVDPDIESVSRFIAQYLSDNNRWTSPKYLLGESYGTTRAAAILNYLREHRALAFNGLILVSVATDIEALAAELPGNERPYAVYLPGYAAVAWYQHMLPDAPAQLAPLLAEVRAYAAGPYTAALLKGDALSDAERDAVAGKMHEYTGLSVEYLKAANLRVSEVEFCHELLKARRQTVGRLDGRFVGPTWDPLDKEADYDPQSAAISAAFASTFLDYYHGELKFGQGATYRRRTSDRREVEVDTPHRAWRSGARELGRGSGGGADEGRQPAGAGAERLLRSRHAVLRDRVRDDAPRRAAGGERARADAVLRGRSHDVRESCLDRQGEARPRHLHRLDRAPLAARRSRSGAAAPRARRCALQAGTRSGPAGSTMRAMRPG